MSTRTVFTHARSADFLRADSLTRLTGRYQTEFACVAVKELVDNALDAAETAGRAPEVRICVERVDGGHRIRVTDNGDGIPPDMVTGLADFSKSTTSKARYRIPTRGAQGNALATLLGMPYALGGDDPVIIETHGVRHSIRAYLDPSEAIQVDYSHQSSEQPHEATSVEIVVPNRGGEPVGSHWARGYAMFNPHALVHFEGPTPGGLPDSSAAEENGKMYKPTAAYPAWRKFMPNDEHSAHWYTAEDLRRLLFAELNAGRKAGRIPTTREFVSTFYGLKRSAKQRDILAQMPGIERLSDFEGREALVDQLLTIMRDASREPNPRVLGVIGEEHFLTRFVDLYGGVRRHWYRRLEDVHRGIPYVFEIVVAETHRPGDIYQGVNFSLSYGEPLGEVSLQAGDAGAFGLRNYLEKCNCYPYSAGNVAVAVHLTCPALTFGDYGKVAIKGLPTAIKEGIADRVWTVCKTRHAEQKRRERDASRSAREEERREREEQPREPKLVEAVFEVLPAAIDKGTGGRTFPVSARGLFYQVRPLLQERTSQPLRYNYFSQTLLPKYQQQNGNIDGLYYIARGSMHEPHDGEPVPLGTREVDLYELPPHKFDKILFVEKQGLWPIIKHARLAEKYDMAVIASQGYPPVACRRLLENAAGRDFQIFVLHDADPDGYKIVRSLREETARMPGYRVEVIDLGLSIADGLARGLKTEEFNRKKALPTYITFTLEELEHFEGQQICKKPPQWRCRRIELDAFTAPAFTAFIEERLLACGVRGKVLPDDQTLADTAEKDRADALETRIGEILDELLDVEKVRREVIESLSLGDLDGATLRATVNQAFDADPHQSWRAVVKRAAGKDVDGCDERLREMVKEQLKAVMLP